MFFLEGFSMARKRRKSEPTRPRLRPGPPPSAATLAGEASKRRLVTAKATFAELKARLLEGSLIDVEEFTAIFGRALIDTRNRLLAVPSKVAPRVRACATTAEVERVIYAEIEQALREISEFKLRPAKR
jgi:phage terminase Nu1 subunit (DNA packaging protein)